MRRLFKSTKRRTSLAMLGLALVVAVTVSVTVAVRSSSASIDEAAIAAVISGFQKAQCDSYAIPADAVATVEDRQAKLRNDPDWRPSATDKNPGSAILPDKAKATMAEKYDAALEKYCTAQYRGPMGSGSVNAADANAGLYNNPQAAPIIEERTEVLAVQVKRVEGSTCIAWAYSWYGDVSAKGKGVQDWQVDEYILVKEGDRWLIDGCTSLGVMDAEDYHGNKYSDEWGPHAPHQPIDEMELEQQSQLYSSQWDLRNALRSLEAEALANK